MPLTSSHKRAHAALALGQALSRTWARIPMAAAMFRSCPAAIGAYVKHGAINATLPNDKTPENLTLDEAIALLAARAAKGGAAKKPARAKATKATKRGAKAPAAKAPAKRPAKRRTQAQGCGRRGRLGGQARQRQNGGAADRGPRLLEFVQASGGKAGKREIARAFAIKGSIGSASRHC